MNTMQTNALEIVKSSLWDTPINMSEEDWNSIYNILAQHSVLSLTARNLKRLTIANDVRDKWKYTIIQHVAYYHRLTTLQNNILQCFFQKKIPAVILKGTAIAQYYPVAEYRTMGDIDVLVRLCDFENACATAISAGWIKIPKDDYKHATYQKDGVVLEVHKRFGSKYILENPQALDDMLFGDMKLGQFTLNPLLNGLVILEHVAQHMRSGIGLRQIIDWMMFVNHHLGDNTWELHFYPLVDKLGLVQLAKVITRMCQIYLGLTNQIQWCRQVDEKLCSDLMEYIMSSGNFGKSNVGPQMGAVAHMPSVLHPIQLYHYVQKRGEKNWRLLDKYPFLRPVACIYQIGRYLRYIRETKQGVRTIVNKGYRQKEILEGLGLHLNID